MPDTSEIQQCIWEQVKCGSITQGLGRKAAAFSWMHPWLSMFFSYAETTISQFSPLRVTVGKGWILPISKGNCRIIEYPELEGTHEAHGVQLLSRTPHLSHTVPQLSGCTCPVGSLPRALALFWFSRHLPEVNER